MPRSQKRNKPGICRVCGCSNFNPCIDESGQTCSWADKAHTLCSFCAPGVVKCILKDKSLVTRIIQDKERLLTGARFFNEKPYTYKAIVALLSQGLRFRYIARILQVSINTVLAIKAHVEGFRSK